MCEWAYYKVNYLFTVVCYRVIGCAIPPKKKAQKCADCSRG